MRRRRLSLDDGEPIARLYHADTVIDDSRLTLFDAHGRRMDRGIGYSRRYLARDPVPQVQRPRED